MVYKYTFIASDPCLLRIFFFASSEKKISVGGASSSTTRKGIYLFIFLSNLTVNCKKYTLNCIIYRTIHSERPLLQYEVRFRSSPGGETSFSKKKIKFRKKNKEFIFFFTSHFFFYCWFSYGGACEKKISFFLELAPKILVGGASSSSKKK
jgi:hypothetical protein